MRRLGALVSVAGVVLLAGCGTQSGQPTAQPSSPGKLASRPAASTPPSAPPSSPSASTAATSTASTASLDWRRLPGSPQDTVLSNGTWTLTVPPQGGSYTLGRGAGGHPVEPPDGYRFSDALLDDDWAVVVAQDKQESRPERATVVDLRGGRSWTLDGSASVPTATGGDWGLSGDRLVHATTHGSSYCIATVDLASRSSTRGWCAPPRHGWSSPVLSPEGDSILTFDDHHPSCRTVVTLHGTSATPYDGVPACKGTQGAHVAGGTVWTEVTDEHRYEQSEVHASTPTGDVDLGPASTGSLIVCGRDAYWAVDAQTPHGTARLMRWDGAHATPVYESGHGQAFLAVPACAGSVLNVASFSTSGSEQVSAAVD